MNEQDYEDPNDIELEEEDDTASNVVGRHDTEPVNDPPKVLEVSPYASDLNPEVAARLAADLRVNPEDFADPVVRDAVARAGDEHRRALVEQIRKEDLGITIDGGFVPSGPRFAPPDPIIGNNTGEPLGFLSFNPSEVVPVVRQDRTIPVGGLPQLGSQLDYDRSVEELRRAFRSFLDSTLVGYGSVSAKNRAAEYMTGALLRMVEPKYHAVWASADYFKSAMESWKEAAGDTEMTGRVLNSSGHLPDHAYGEAARGFLGSVTPDDGLERPPLATPLGDDFVYLSLPKHEIPSKVAEYVSAMETQRTNEWCKCQWIVHPDDVDLPAHGERKRRMRRGDTHPQCAVHTKEGFILGFFEWYFRDVSEQSEEDTQD